MVGHEYFTIGNNWILIHRRIDIIWVTSFEWAHDSRYLRCFGGGVGYRTWWYCMGQEDEWQGYACPCQNMGSKPVDCKNMWCDADMFQHVRMGPQAPCVLCMPLHFKEMSFK
jgi:hypothetical protein